MKKTFILTIFFLLFSCSASKTLSPDLNEHKIVSFVAVGDNLIHATVYEAAAINNTYDFKPIFSEIKPYIRQFDLAFINQETILGGKEIGLSTYPCFNSPFELGDALVDTGFNLISMANNHTLDRGETAVVNAVNYWQTQDVIFSGASLNPGSQVKKFTKNEITFAYVAYTYGTNGILPPKGKDYLANVFTYEKAKADLENIDSDFIIVSMHWGNEYESLPSKEQMKQANFLANLGVDVIIGHHPHVIQPLDMLEHDGHKTLVIYSLGNFLSDQKGIDRLIGMAVSFNIEKEEDVQIKNLKASLLYRYKFNNHFNIKMFIDLNDTILENYQTYYEDKKRVITTYYDDVIIT
jgi:poly-gamma-glutamate synthesis protein (capsule biosynthesis protein)